MTLLKADTALEDSMMLKSGVFVALVAGSLVLAGCAEVDRGAQDGPSETVGPPTSTPSASPQPGAPSADASDVAEASSTIPAPEADPPRKSVMRSLFRAVGKGAYDAVTGEETAGESVPSANDTPASDNSANDTTEK